MADYPKEIRVFLSRSSKSGLFAAESPDLPGLLTVGRTIDDLEHQLPGDIQSLISAMYNVDVVVDLTSPDERDFRPLAEPRVARLAA